ncbi:MAG: helix-turn-helix domain-containing protein [Anaerotignum sp.]|nr:helix-turn-helix domain-containing protein [Anaerotignum sp.]
MTKLYEAGDHILLCAAYADPAEHRHMAAHIILAMKGEIMVTAEGEVRMCRGVMIPSGVSHRVETKGNPVLVFLYDSATNVARRISRMEYLSAEICDTITAAYLEFEKTGMAEAYGVFEKIFLCHIAMESPAYCVTDKRVLEAIAHIRENLSEKLLCQNVAASVFLSEGRFSHLFREQTGMPFASYLIYQRLMYVYGEILRGKSITEAALAAGFSSSAHFADVNRRVFGLSAGNITRNMVFCKVR